MKQAVFGLITGSIVLLMIGMLLTLMTRNVRVEELRCSLAEAMEATMKQYVKEESNFTEKEMTTYLETELKQQISSDSEVTLDIICADSQLGLLSAEAEAVFTYPLGQRGSIRCKRTIVTDRKLADDVVSHKVSFFESKEDMQAGKIYKQYTVQQGEKIISPVEPQSLKQNFLEWRDSMDYLADFSQEVTQDRSYYAVYE